MDNKQYFQHKFGGIFYGSGKARINANFKRYEIRTLQDSSDLSVGSATPCTPIVVARVPTDPGGPIPIREKTVDPVVDKKKKIFTKLKIKDPRSGNARRTTVKNRFGRNVRHDAAPRTVRAPHRKIQMRFTV